MFVLGLVLVILSAGALVAVLASGADDTAVLYGGSLEMPTLVVFLLGAGALLLFVVGLELIRSGIKRAGQVRRDSRRLRKLEHREQERRRSESEEVGAEGPEPAGEESDPGSGVPETSPGPTAEADRTPTTETPGTSGNGGPYQAPPPPSR